MELTAELKNNIKHSGFLEWEVISSKSEIYFF